MPYRLARGAMGPRAVCGRGQGMQCEGRHAAILLKDLGGGGIQKMRLAIARAFVACGHRVELLAMRPEGAFIWRAEALAGGAARAELVLGTLWPASPRDALAYVPALAA